MKAVRRILVLGERDNEIFERQQHARVYFQGKVEVERAPAPLFRMEVDLPGLAQGVRLDEVPLIMNVKAVVNGMIFKFGNVPCNIYDSHHGPA
jgi:hypothetical protein